VTFTPAVIACESAPAASSLMTSHNRIEIVLPDRLRLIADATLDAIAEGPRCARGTALERAAHDQSKAWMAVSTCHPSPTSTAIILHVFRVFQRPSGASSKPSLALKG
jgi:hypothetical protein